MKRLVCLLLMLSVLVVSAALAEEAPERESLYKLTMPYGFKMGAALSYDQMKNPRYISLVKQHFNSITATNEMKAYSLLDEAGSKASADGMPVLSTWALSRADEMVGWAQKCGIGMRGHVLVWDAYMCDWFFHEGYDTAKPYADPETIKARTENYITQVVSHFEEKFPGVVYCWDVVNEAVGDSASEWLAGDPRHLRTMRSGVENLFQKYMGDDYVELSFLYARNAVEALGADIRLYLNDYNAYFPEKSAAILALAESVNSFATNGDGTPRKLCDGIGMQGYIGGYGVQQGCMEPSHPGMIKTAIETYAAAGFEVQITEMAVRNFELEQADRHAAFYAELFRTFKSLNGENGNPLNAVSIWGLVDNPNLPKDNYVYRMNSPYGGLFDEKYAEKDALARVMEAMKE